MVPSFPLLSCESSVSVKENPDRKKIKIMFCYKKRPEQFHISLEQNLNFFSSASKLKFGTKSFKRDLISIQFFNQLRNMRCF